MKNVLTLTEMITADSVLRRIYGGLQIAHDGKRIWYTSADFRNTLPMDAIPKLILYRKKIRDATGVELSIAHIPPYTGFEKALS